MEQTGRRNRSDTLDLTRFAAVVFDLDGLLVDTEILWKEAKQRLFGRYGVALHADDHRAVYGSSEGFTARYFAGRLGLGDEQVDALIGEYLDTVRGLFREGIAMRPGALELVTELRGQVPLGLASNTRRELVDLTLAQTGLAGCFDAIATGDEVEPKPAPDIYLLACERLGVAPGDAAAVEDSPTGVLAAKAAGLFTIGVPSEPSADLAGADVMVRSLVELSRARPTR